VARGLRRLVPAIASDPGELGPPEPWRQAALPILDADPLATVGQVQVTERLLVAGLRAHARADEAEAARRRLAFLFHAAQQLGGSLEPASTVQALAQLIVPEFGDASLVHTMDCAGRRGELTLVASASLGPHPVEWWDWLARTTRPAARRAIRRAASEIGSTGTKRPSRASSDFPEVTYLIVPVRTRGRTLGTLTAVSLAATRRYKHDDLVMGEALSSQAGLALENAQLYEQQRAMVNRLQQVRVELDTAQSESLRDNERRRIARDLHDRVEQIFFAIGLTARAGLDRRSPATPADEQLAEALTRASDLAAAGAEQLRESIFALNNAKFATVGLVSVLWKLVRAYQQRTRVETDLVLTGPQRAMPTEVAETLHAVAREALANVERHAHAAAVVLGLHFSQGSVTLTVHDDGAGASALVMKQIDDSATHFGLRGLRDRLQRLHGTLAVGPAPDGGFVVRAHINLSAADTC
jgi:signal transduction histidine kinase